jgi:hypothetical protein
MNKEGDNSFSFVQVSSPYYYMSAREDTHVSTASGNAEWEKWEIEFAGKT